MARSIIRLAASIRKSPPQSQLHYSPPAKIRPSRLAPRAVVRVRRGRGGVEGSTSGYCESDSQGYYVFGGLRMGETYTVAPVQFRVAFSPSEATVVMPGNDVNNVDFSGSDVSWRPGWWRKEESPPLPITAYTTVQSTIDVAASGPLTDLNVFVRLHHTWIGDLKVTLISPSGTRVVLHNSTGGSNDDIITWYDTETTPAESLDRLIGEDLFGTWTLEVYDRFSLDDGELVEWMLELYSSDLSLSGTVRKDGAPCPGATVLLQGAVRRHCTSDAQGNYSFGGLQPGTTYTVSPYRCRVAFTPASTTIVMPGQDVDADFNGTQDIAAPGLWRTQENPPLSLEGYSTVESTLAVDFDGPVSELNVFVDIRHPRIRDLKVTLVSPSGTSAVLHNHTGSYYDRDLTTWYDTETTPAESLVGFNGEGTAGTWTLQLYDYYSSCSGELVEWMLELYSTNLDIAGTLREEGGQPIPGAMVHLQGASCRTAYTDASGTYQFQGVLDGTYRVCPEASDFAYLPVFRQVVVSGYDQLGHDFIGLPMSRRTLVRDETPDLPIPDGDPDGVCSVIEAADSFRIALVEVYVDIQHVYIGDVRVALVSPFGEEFLLHNRTGGSTDDLIGWFGVSGMTPVDSFDSLRGSNVNGDWTLRVDDYLGGYTGTLREWRLRFSYLRFNADVTVSLGSGSFAWMEAFDRSAGGSYRHFAWKKLPWSGYCSANLGCRACLGDVDGDGYDEIAVGLDPYPASGGWIALLDDARSTFGLLRWVRVPWAHYNRTNGETNVAAGDLDGDGRDELLVGLGSCPSSGGWVALIDDAVGDYGDLGWLRVQWGRYNSVNGETLPTAGRMK